MKCVSREKKFIFQVQRCIFQLVRCIIPIWRPPDISGGRHLENAMYISSKKMYISITSHPVEIYIFPLEIYISFCKWRPPDWNNTSQQLKYTSLLMIIYILFWH